MGLLPVEACCANRRRQASNSGSCRAGIEPTSVLHMLVASSRNSRPFKSAWYGMISGQAALESSRRSCVHRCLFKRGIQTWQVDSDCRCVSGQCTSTRVSASQVSMVCYSKLIDTMVCSATRGTLMKDRIMINIESDVFGVVRASASRWATITSPRLQDGTSITLGQERTPKDIRILFQ